MTWNFFCKPHDSKLKFATHNSVTEIPTDEWNSILKGKNIYLSLSYLQALELAMKESMEFKYLVFYDDAGSPVGISSLQLLKFIDRGTKYYEPLCIVSGKIADSIFSSLGIKVLICGNVFSCGENGFIFSDDIPLDEAYSSLCSALAAVRENERSKGKISIVLLKEFWPESFKKTDKLKSYDFRDFMIDVNMVLPIHPTWNNLDDYLFSMTTKFRTRAKSVFKRSVAISSRELNASAIELHKEKIQTLYNNVQEKADFKFGKLSSDAFVRFKKNLADAFIFTAYFLEEELIGFSTAFVSEDFIDANYVGLNYTLNKEYALYQRMLYDFVELSIQKECAELRLGRTAEEIKSCIGAQPTNMKLYIRHRNSVSNKLLKPIIESIEPSEFSLRRPFKAAFQS